MEMIVISKKRFDELFSVCLDKLSLVALKESRHNYKVNDDTHRKFHYEIATLKSELRDS